MRDIFSLRSIVVTVFLACTVACRDSTGIGRPESLGRVVTPRRPLLVVRTDPPPRKRDVPLNAVIAIVFSDPIDLTTVDAGSIVLSHGTTLVPGTLRFVDAAHVRAEFSPSALLDAETDYELVISPTIRDVNGVALESSVTVPFTTGTNVVPVATLKQVEVTIETTGVDLDPDGYGILNDEWDYDTGDGVTVPAPVNGTVTLFLRAGDHALSLVGVASNCSGKQLDDRPVVVDAGTAITQIDFRVVCTAR